LKNWTELCPYTYGTYMYYYYYYVIPAWVLRQWTPAMLANLHYSARRAARKHTDLETEVKLLFIPCYMYSTCIDRYSRQRTENVSLAKKCHGSQKTISGYRNQSQV
jgi:hypothetical protein